MPDGFLGLIVICAVVLIVLKIIKASVKLMFTATFAAAVVWFCINILPNLSI